ncbi:MAG: TIR domain-containing protein [Promethearchaeota archaeon]
MSKLDQMLTCASCGLPLRDERQYRWKESFLCATCTYSDTMEPDFEAVVFAMAVGYFMGKQKMSDPAEALNQAFDYVNKLPYWQEQPPEVSSLERARSLAPHMQTLELQTGLLEDYDFFISHKHAQQPDEEVVRPLAEALHAQGYMLWFDAEKWLKKAGSINEWMKRGIKQARHFILVLCQQYFHSKSCMYELEKILEMKAKKDIFPIWWTDITGEYLKNLANEVDWRDLWEDIDEAEGRRRLQTIGQRLLDLVGMEWKDYQKDIDQLRAQVVQLAQDAEGLQEYQEVPLVTSEARALERLESILQEHIPPVDWVRDPSADKEPLPPSFGFMHMNHHITGLFLENKSLRELPSFIGQCSALKHLHLAQNKLTTLPKFVGSLKLDTLTYTGNSFVSLPDSVMTNHHRFFTAHHPQVAQEEAIILFLLEWHFGTPIPPVDKIEFKTFGFKVENKHITGLGLYNKRLNSLPESFGQLRNLQILNLRGNRLDSLPESFGQLTSLQTLNLRWNDLRSLPETFGNLVNLKKLNLWDNKLSSLPESFKNLTKLEMLFLGGNPLRSLPESVKELQKRGCKVFGVDHLE